ncbi:hypothetical protein HY414_00885 [Candidatus Kaiserbacteria bacterium]|nr:hypothetical protein [Candidatus Kaiserbacteria bacterium]
MPTPIEPRPGEATLGGSRGFAIPGVSMQTDWEVIGRNSILAFTVAIVVMLLLPGNAGESVGIIDLIHTVLAYAWGLLCIGHIYVQGKMVKEREIDPIARAEAGVEDVSRSQLPKFTIYMILIVKPILYVAFADVWNPFEIFYPWQILAGLAAWVAVRFDIKILSWFDYRISQLQNELNVERRRR